MSKARILLLVIWPETNAAMKSVQHELCTMPGAVFDLV